MRLKTPNHSGNPRRDSGRRADAAGTNPSSGSTWRRSPGRWLLAGLFPLAALALQWLLWERLRPYVWLFFYPAVFLSSWAGGRVAGLLATAFSAIAVWFLFIPPSYSFSLEQPSAGVALLIFTGMGVVFSLFHERLRRADRQVQLALAEATSGREHLEQLMEERTKDLVSLVTELRRKEADLRRSQELLKLFIEYAPVPLAMFDREMRYLYASRRWRSDFGLGDRTLVNVSHYDIFPEIPEHWKELHRRGFAGETLREEAEAFQRADGSVQWLRWELRPWYDGDGMVGGIVIFSEDITNRKCAEDALQKLNEELELRVAQRTEKLDEILGEREAQNAELQRAYHELEVETAQRIRAVEELRQKEQLLIHQSRLAAMGEMLGYIAHQWRQPLNVLGLNLQVLGLSYQHGRFNQELLEESVEKAMGIIRHLSRTIDDFRDFLVLNKEKTLFQVDEVIVKTVGLIEENFKKAGIGIELTCTEPPQVSGFPNEYSHVILNLLTNARDAFLERRTDHPVIRVQSGAEQGRTVVTIADNAGGIPEDIIGKIFDAYFTTKGLGKGSGVGLFMSKMIIEKNMGGRLTVSNVNGGAEFRIEV